MGENTALSGMLAIRDFCRSINLASSEASVIQMIQNCGFPAKKILGIWESDKEEIMKWRKKYINENINGFETEADQVRVALKQAEGNKAKAARLLGIDRKTLYRMIVRLKLDTAT